jgi:hypothetical protein
MRNQRWNPLIESGLAGGWGWELGRPCSTPQPFTPGQVAAPTQDQRGRGIGAHFGGR